MAWRSEPDRYSPDTLAAASRRGVLLGLGAALLGAATPATRATEVAPGVFVLPGLDEDAAADNLDAIANTGFVIGRDAVGKRSPKTMASPGPSGVWQG